MTTLLLVSLAALVSAQNGYAPALTTCPTAAGSLLRSGTTGGLNANEVAYTTAHRQAVASQWTTFMNAHNTGYDLSQLAPNATSWPTFGIAASGGGYRAALYGAGSLTAFDNRNTSSGLAGVTQLATYISGLSGGSWAVGSWAINGFPNPTQLVLGNASANLNGWQLQYNLLVPGGLTGLTDNADFLNQITAQVQSKEDAGWNTSITDAWGRALSYHFAPGTTGDNFYQSNATAHGANLNWNSFTSSQAWTSSSVPFPIVVADSRPPNMTTGATPFSAASIPLNSTEYEFTAFEWGSHDTQLNAFLNVTHLGTHLTNGQPDNSTGCTVGFQNFGFVIGTSSSLFNAILATANSTLSSGELSILQSIFDKIDGGIRNADDDVANYPNSFESLQGRESWNRFSSDVLDLVDGGLNGENVPLTPLLVPARQVDTIIALDASADTTQGWPNATSLYATRDRIALLSNERGFPELPPNFTAFVGGGYNTHPTFFGCNVTALNDTTPQLIVYLPNAPTPAASYLTNTSTFKLDYSVAEASAFLDAAHANALQTGRDGNWPVCLTCALVDRTRQRRGLPRSSVCETCFTNYCYNPATLGAAIAANGGTTTTTTPRSAGVSLSPLTALPTLLALLALSMVAV